MSDFVFGFLYQIGKKAETIEREKDGKALTADEAKTLQAADFLRKIAPYAFPKSEADK